VEVGSTEDGAKRSNVYGNGEAALRCSRKMALIGTRSPAWADLAEIWAAGRFKREQIPRLKPGSG